MTTTYDAIMIGTERTRGGAPIWRLRIDLDGHGAHESLADYRLRILISVAMVPTSLTSYWILGSRFLSEPIAQAAMPLSAVIVLFMGLL